jgi:hypothetical protein
MELSDATARRLFDELQQMETRLSERIAGRCDGLELRIGERCDEPHTHFTSRCDGIQQQVASLFDSFNGTATSSATAPRYDDVFGSSTGTAYDDAFATSASAAAPSPSYDDDEPVFDAWPIFDEESIDSTASQALFSDGADHCFGDELDTGRTMEFCYNDDNHIGVDVDIDILPTFEFDIKQTVVVASSTKDSLELTGADQRSSNPGHSTSTMDAMMQLLLDEMALMEARITDVIEGRSSLSDTEATVGSRARNIPDSVVADLAADHLFGGAFGLDNLTPMAAQAPSAEEIPQPQAEVVASSESEPATYAELAAALTKCSMVALNGGTYSVPNPTASLTTCVFLSAHRVACMFPIICAEINTFRCEACAADTDVSQEASELTRISEKVMLYLGTTNLWDYLPFLRWFDVFLWLLIDGERRRMDDDGNGEKKSMTVVLLSLQRLKLEQYTDIMVMALCWDLFGAGTETTSVTTEWAPSLLLNHPEALKKAQAELDAVVGSSHLITTDDMCCLGYLHCIINETLHMYSAAMLLLPHESIVDCKVDGYDSTLSKDDGLVDGLRKCEQWKWQDIFASKETKTSSWFHEFIGRAKKPEMGCPPFGCGCGWDVVPYKQPWPPPMQFMLLGDGVQVRPMAWPSFYCYAALVRWIKSLVVANILTKHPWLAIDRGSLFKVDCSYSTTGASLQYALQLFLLLGIFRANAWNCTCPLVTTLKDHNASAMPLTLLI